MKNGREILKGIGGLNEIERIIKNGGENERRMKKMKDWKKKRIEIERYKRN